MVAKEENGDQMRVREKKSKEKMRTAERDRQRDCQGETDLSIGFLRGDRLNLVDPGNT